MKRRVSVSITLLAALWATPSVEAAKPELSKATSMFRAYSLPRVYEGPDAKGIAIPESAVQLWAGETRPAAVKEYQDKLFVTYDNGGIQTGVLFDPQTGEVIERDLAANLKDAKELTPLGQTRDGVTGFGVEMSHAMGKFPTTEYRGFTWTIVQSAPESFAFGPKAGDTTWTKILSGMNDKSHLLANNAQRKYTTKEGLASNIVSQLAVAGDTLWAACVDIYDYETADWGPGGLCRYDSASDRWVQQTHINGLPVRWVSMLQPDGDDLWISFWLGGGVTGDHFNVQSAKGRHGDYGPFVNQIVVAQLSGGKWKTYTRYPAWGDSGAPHHDYGRLIKKVDDKWLLLTTHAGSYRENGYGLYLFDPKDSGRSIWADANVQSGVPMQYPPQESSAGQLVLQFENNAPPLYSRPRETSFYLWYSKKISKGGGYQQAWQRLDPKSTLPIGEVGTAAIINDQIWLGGVGIGYFNEADRTWSWKTPHGLNNFQPVWQLQPSSDGAIWVLFRARPEEMSSLHLPGERDFGLAQSPHFWGDKESFERDHTVRFGIGKLAGDDWQFPVELPTYLDPESGLKRAIVVKHMEAIGNDLFVQNQGGVYAGPEKWMRICDGLIAGLTTTDDGKKLIIPRIKGSQLEWRLDQRQDWDKPTPEMERGTYDPATKMLTWEAWPIAKDSPEAYQWEHPSRWFPGLRAFEAESADEENRDVNSRWWLRRLRLPIEGKRQLGLEVAGDGRDESRFDQPACIQTKDALWLISQALVVRFDRQKLEEVLAKAK